MRTANLRQEHQAILEIAGRIVKLMKVAPESMDGDALRKELVALNAAVGIHLAGEDKGLYPDLLKAKDSAVNQMAKRFADEMGAIGEVFRNYMKGNPTGAVIKSKGAAFVNETQGLFQALGQRIEREEKELYPLLDKMGGSH